MIDALNATGPVNLELIHRDEARRIAVNIADETELLHHR